MENIFEYEQMVHKKLMDAVEGVKSSYTKEDFENAQVELEMWQQQGEELGADLREIAINAADARRDLEEICFELYGHHFDQEGICENCLKLEEEPTTEPFDWDR